MKKNNKIASSSRHTSGKDKTASKKIAPDIEVLGAARDDQENEYRNQETLDILDGDELTAGEILDVDDKDSLDMEPELALEEDHDAPLPATSLPRLPSPAGTRDSLHLYLREVSRFPMLHPEEEHELALRVRDHNDPDAAFRLVSSHLRLVVRIAMDFQRRWMQNVLDLVQEGNVGLMRAVNKFDPDKGIKFSYYASFWIKA